MQELKKDLVRICREKLQEKTALVNRTLLNLKDDLENDTKSSAGDKYETGREMINIEWNKLNAQLRQYDEQLDILNRIEKQSPSSKLVRLGSIVKTDKANYFIAIPSGEINVTGERFYSVGIQAPVARILLGKSPGEYCELNGVKMRIMKLI